MNNFSHRIAPLKLHFGADALAHLARDLDAAGVSRAVVVTGKTLASDDRIIGALEEALGPRIVTVHPGARPHSPLPDVLETASVLAQSGADGVIALGGGSAVVTARAAAIALAEGEDLRSLATSRDAAGRLHSPRLSAPKLPQFVIPTTPATAMVKAGSAVLDPVDGVRLALFDPKTRAISVALVPELLMTAPRKLVVEAGLGLLLLSVEGLLSRQLDPIAEALLLQSLRLAGPALEHGDLDSAEARSDLAKAAVLAGRGTDHAGGGIAAALGHGLGPRLHLPNALINAIVMPEVLRFVVEAARPAISLAARTLQAPADDAEGLIDCLSAIRARLGLPGRLRDLGIQSGILLDVAEHCLLDWSLRGSARPVEKAQELHAILQAAW